MTTTNTELDTTGTSLPAAPRGVGVAAPWPRWRIAVAAACALVFVVIAASTLAVPYASILPGSARPVAQLVSVRGHEAYPPKSSVAFTTVSVRQSRFTLADAFLGWLDDDVDVYPRDVLFGGRSSAENQRYNAQLMDTSKAIAITVALERLGYTVPIRTSGTVVRELQPDSPASQVLERDDVIVAVDGQPVDVPGEIGTLLATGGVGAEHELTVERPPGSAERVTVRAKTIAADDDPNRAILGFVPEERLAGFDFPVDVSIDSGTVGGPSAGLAFTLAVLDVLTPGELTGGTRVAVTGTMALDGTVGPVGGGRQKAIAVRNAGYGAFLVPTDEYDEVNRAVGSDLRVIAVDTLDEALDALASLGGNARSLQSEGVGASS
jgi:PDZ domain-containing protein